MDNQDLPIAPKSKKLNPLYFVIGTLVIISAVLGYLLWDKNAKLSDANQAMANSQATEAQADKVEVADDTDEPVQSAQPAEPTGSACKLSSVYKAEVGKFTISLKAPYVIVRQIDGGFEGGPATRLEIAKCLNDEANVYDQFPSNEVSVLANPNATAAELKSRYESEIALIPDGNVTIDGVSANRYKANGLFTSLVIIFEHSGIGYQIDATEGAEGNKILTDLISDWKF